MRNYKLGNIEASSIVLNKQGCININKSMKLHQARNIEREYKVFKVNAQTGEVVSMKMYKS